MNFLAMEIRPGHVIRVEYGMEGNITDFTVKEVRSDDVFTYLKVVSQSGIISDTIRFENKKILQIVDQKEV